MYFTPQPKMLMDIKILKNTPKKKSSSSTTTNPKCSHRVDQNHTEIGCFYFPLSPLKGTVSISRLLHDLQPTLYVWVSINSVISLYPVCMTQLSRQIPFLLLNFWTFNIKYLHLQMKKDLFLLSSMLSWV